MRNGNSKLATACMFSKRDIFQSLSVLLKYYEQGLKQCSNNLRKTCFSQKQQHILWLIYNIYREYQIIEERTNPYVSISIVNVNTCHSSNDQLHIRFSPWAFPCRTVFFQEPSIIQQLHVVSIQLHLDSTLYTSLRYMVYYFTTKLKLIHALLLWIHHT